MVQVHANMYTELYIFKTKTGKCQMLAFGLKYIQQIHELSLYISSYKMYKNFGIIKNFGIRLYHRHLSNENFKF